MELFLRLFAILLRFICHISNPIYWLFTKIESKVPLQPIRKPILTFSATQLAAKIRTGELSCEDVVQAYIFRSRRVNLKLSTIVEDRYDAALEEARKVDQLIASRTKSIKELEEEMPLLGVPISVKACCKVKDMSYNVGSVLRLGKKADSDGVAVGYLRKAGAIPIAVTNQSELCLFTETYSPVCGLTVNPYNMHRTVGGSSGGEAALISSAGSVVGVSSDLIASIRCPAMFTGIFCHRPTPKIVSLEGHYPGGDCDNLKDLIVIVPLVRYAEDLPLMTKILAGNQGAKLKLNEKTNLKNLTVHYMIEAEYSIGLPTVDKDIKSAIINAVDYLRKTYNSSVKKVNFREISDCPEIIRSLNKIRNIPDIIFESNSANHEKCQNNFKEVLKNFMKLPTLSLVLLQYNIMKILNCIIPVKRAHYYMNQSKVLKEKITVTLGEDGILICPIFPTPAHYHYQSLFQILDGSYCTLFACLGLPATTVPMGLDKTGLPIGFQIVAAPYQDRMCFAVAQELEKSFGGWTHPPSLQTPSDNLSCGIK